MQERQFFRPVQLLIRQDRVQILEPGLLHAPVFSVLLDNPTDYGPATISADVLKIAPGFDGKDAALVVLKDIQLTAVPSRRKTAGLNFKRPGLSDDALVLGGLRSYALCDLHDFFHMEVCLDRHRMRELHTFHGGRQSLLIQCVRDIVVSTDLSVISRAPYAAEIIRLDVFRVFSDGSKSQKAFEAYGIAVFVDT